METLAERIKARMKELKLTQESLARAVGLTQPGVFKLTSGKQPTTTKILELAQALRVTPEWLLTGEEGRLPATKPEIEHEPPRPPVIDDEAWRELSPKVRSFVEDFLLKTKSELIEDEEVRALHEMVDLLSKNKLSLKQRLEKARLENAAD